MNADAIIQRINNAAKRLRASEKKLAADESQITSLRALRAQDADMRSRLESKVKQDKTQISRLKLQVAEDKKQLEKNASEIERLTASQLSISEEAAKLKQELDAKQKKLDEGYNQYELGMTGFKKLEKKHSKPYEVHIKNMTTT